MSRPYRDRVTVTIHTAPYIQPSKSSNRDMIVSPSCRDRITIVSRSLPTIHTSLSSTRSHHDRVTIVSHSRDQNSTMWNFRTWLWNSCTRLMYQNSTLNVELPALSVEFPHLNERQIRCFHTDAGEQHAIHGGASPTQNYYSYYGEGLNASQSSKLYDCQVIKLTSSHQTDFQSSVSLFR